MWVFRQRHVLEGFCGSSVYPLIRRAVLAIFLKRASYNLLQNYRQRCFSKATICYKYIMQNVLCNTKSATKCINTLIQMYYAKQCFSKGIDILISQEGSRGFRIVK